MIDKELRALGLRPPPSPASRLGAVAPVPYVGVAAILVALIIFTPVLLASGPSSLAVEAELAVYRVVGAPTTEFIVHAYDPDVAYSWINVSVGAVASDYVWNGSCPGATQVNWTALNDTHQLVLSVDVASNPVVVNASAVYDNGGSRSVYEGEMAFYVTNLGTSSESLAYAPCPWTPGITPSGSWPVSSGTVTFLLVNYGAGGHP